MKPITDQGYKLLHEGAVALSQVETNGIRMDVDYLNRVIKKTGIEVKEISDRLKQHKIYRVWRKHYGVKTNLGSREQLGKVLFDIMDYPCTSRTEKVKRPKADEAALKLTGLRFVDDYLYLERLKKARSTYLVGFLRETVDGFVHPNFPLNMVQTYRGSSSNPDFQNIVKKNPELSKLIRRAFIARKNHQIVEIDFKGIEVCCAACYHKDPAMIRYIKDPSMDMHRDMACECYMIDKKQVSWDARDTSKNMFVFPQQYGDWYKHCAQNMWDAMIERDIRTVDGIKLIRHLKRMGITSLGDCDPEEEPEEGTFEYHIQGVEYDYWHKKFPVYNQWKQDWYEAYLEKGYFKTLTGFIIDCYLNRKQVINYPVQGSAFHWLLWSLIRIQKLLKRYRMRSLIVGQIHDSIVGDVHKRERRDYLDIVKQVIYEDIRKHWKWIIVPLRVDVGVAPVGGSWYDKKEVKI